MLDPRTWRGLYAIVDPDHCAGRAPVAVAADILAGGCAVLQLRDKRSPTDRAALAADLLPLCRAASVPFVINDDLDLALQLGADGVHLGQDDLPVERARARAGTQLIIGLSTHDLAQASSARNRGADLIGFGPIFNTATKQNPDPTVGPATLRTLCTTVDLPVVAIGGINLMNLAEVRATGCPLVAVISAICTAPDPRTVAAALHRALQD